jgi:site-specific recombinase XerD
MPRARKRLPLVCQHLENISRDALETYLDVIRAYVRHRQGVYALYRKTKLYYVGLAKDLRWRLNAHLKDHHGQSWDRFSVYLTIGDQHLKELESLVLRIVKPKGNEVKGKFAKSQDLRRKFAHDIRLIQRQELDRLIGRVREVDIEEEPPDSGRRAPVLAAHFSLPTRLRAIYKGKTLRAHVRRDGRIRWNNYLAPRCADLWMRDLRTCDVQGILNQIASQHDLSAATVQRCKSLLSGIFSHAKTQGYFDGINPVHETEIPANTHQSAETYAYSPEEINDMLRTLPNPAHAVIATASYAGLTKSEIEGMTWECYSGSELNVVRARVHGKFGEPKTKKRRGAVHVSPVLKGVLDKYRLACGNPVTGPMFVNAKGFALDLNNLANRVIGPILDEHGMQWHGYHACRRGLATRLHDQKVDDLTVRDVLRHGDVKTTIRSYIKVLPQAVIDAVNRQHDDLCTSCAPFASEKVSLPN